VAEALRLARERGRDLVEVAPTATPPVCRILDYGKYRYEISKREKEAKKKQHYSRMKEIKIRPNIDPHDYQVKLRKALEFLGKGLKLRLTMMFRGREMARQDLGKRTLIKLVEDLKNHGTMDGGEKMIGRRLTLVVNPGHAKAPTPAPKPSAQPLAAQPPAVPTPVPPPPVRPPEGTNTHA
jgi:translation initiation factor IF-3